MADCGTTASFIDSLFAQLHRLKFISMQHPCDLTVADGRIISSRTITHTVRIALTLEAHREVLELYITTLGQYPVVLGLPWLQKHDPRICFSENTITFNSKHCLDYCIITHQAMTIRGADTVFDALHESHKTHEIHKTPQTCETRRSTLKPRYNPCSSHQIDMADCTRKMNRELMQLENLNATKHYTAGAARQPTKHITGEARNLTKDITSAARRLDISMIGAAPFNHLVQQSQKNSKI